MDSSNENRIQYLLNRCMAGQETVQERNELNAYFADEKSHQIMDEALLNSFYQPKDLVDMPKEKQEQILHAIHSLDRPDLIKKTINWKWGGIAAVLLIAFLSILFFDKKEESISKEVIVQTKEDKTDAIDTLPNKIVQDRNPAKDVALLEMADGTRIELAQLDSEQVIVRDGITLKRLAEGTLSMHFVPTLSKKQNLENRIHTVKTPRGGTYKIVLVDGTTVHLNASSKLSFPTSFATNERRVSLEGEGYFDVAKDSERQFIVQTKKGKEKQDIVVYGTQFNINAYPENDGIVTTLVEGSIKVRYKENEQFLKPLQQAVVKSGQIQTSPANMDANLAWINNIFYFADEPLANVMEQISRWYDIDVSYAGKAPSIRLWGQISRTKKLSEVLEILRQTNDVRFKVNGKEVMVMD